MKICKKSLYVTHWLSGYRNVLILNKEFLKIFPINLVDSSNSCNFRYNKTLNMSKKTLVMDGMSFVYRVTFEDGSTYFQRAADCWSVNSYRNHLISLFNNESRNTEFERKFFIEKSSAKIDIVFKGSTEEAIKVKDRLVSETPNTLNTKVRGNLNHKAPQPLKLKKEFTKVMSSGGDSIIFIDREYGYRMGLKEKMDGYKKHPMYSSFVKLNVYNVERF